MNSKFNFLLLIIVSLIVLVYYQISTVRTSTTSRGEPPVIGWIEGNCFAVTKNDVESGVYIFVVTLDGSQDFTEAQILGKATDEKCKPLAVDRRTKNLAANLSFYEIKPATSFKSGIGVLGKIGRRKIKKNMVHADIDNDRKAEQYTKCTTREGIKYHVWKSAPYQKDPYWSGYNYLGHNIEPTCPK